MFDSIHGRLTRSDPTRAVVVAHGIGYEVHLPISTYEVLPPPGDEVLLLLHPIVRETEWRLFGFATSGERDVFRALLRVTGIGPTLALSLLSGLTPAEFRGAVQREDVKTLTGVKGIGRKTAERILVELKDVVEQAVPGEAGAVPEAAAVGGAVDDAVHALVALGLSAREARRRVEAQLEGDTEVSVTDLVRGALRG